jgi:hypothetical protein
MIELPYEEPDSLWDLIKSLANPSEFDALYECLGPSLIDQSVELHCEVKNLLSIWRDYRSETDEKIGQLTRRSSPLTAHNSILTEPPTIRETMKREIQLFIEQMRKQCGNDEKTFRAHVTSNKHNLKVINYALNIKGSGKNINNNVYKLKENSTVIERPRTVLDIKTNCETPIIRLNNDNDPSSSSNTSRSGNQTVRYRSESKTGRLSISRCCSRQSLNNSNFDIISSPILSMNSLQEDTLELLIQNDDKINLEHVESISENLRSLLVEECDTLKKDIDFLYECIEAESEYRSEAKDAVCEPTINELKDERRRLEADLLSSKGQNQVNISKLPSSVSSAHNNRAINSPLNYSNRSSPSPKNSTSDLYNRSNLSSASSINSVSSAIKKINPLPLKKVSSNVDINPGIKQKKQFTFGSTITLPTDKQKIPVAKQKTIPKLQTTRKSVENLNLKPSKSKLIKTLEPISNRLYSGASVDSSVISIDSARSNDSRVSSAQKFRDMVVGFRDSSN